MDYKFKTVPFNHQGDCWERNRRLKYFAYLMEMGTGKSKVLLDTASYMFDEGIINAVIIFANKGSYTNWTEQEIPAHFPYERITTEVFLWKSSMNKSEQKVFSRIFSDNMTEMKILVMNIEALAYERSRKVAERFVNAYQTLAVVDESTTIKNMKAKRTKAALKIGRLAKARRIMTGSVVDNNPLDAYSQFEFLAPGCLGFQSYYSFRNYYAELADMTTKNSPRPFKIVVGYKNIDDLHKRLAKISFIIKKKECLDLPPKIYQRFEVDLTPEQKRLYEDLRQRSITEISGEMVSVKIVLTKLLRLHQLVCGHIKDDEGKVYEVPNNRVSALKTVLEEVSGQAIIWANYRDDIFAIDKFLRKEYDKDPKKESCVLTYFGDTSDANRTLAKETFKRGQDTQGKRFLVGNPQTGGYGLNLTGANTVIYYSNSFDAEKRNQSEDRAHRIGQTDKVTYIDIVAPGTIDEKVP
jgi:SNF2 family DNA or RNA helicase